MTDGRIPFERFAEEDPDCLCVIDCDEHSWTRADVLQVARNLVEEFRQRGLVAGDRVAIVAPNCVEYLAGYLAAVYSGLTFVPINRNLTPGEISYVIEDSAASLLLLHHSTQCVVSSAARPIGVVQIGLTTPAYGYCTWSAPRAAVPGGVMFYTSATTGKPKEVLRPGHDTLEALRKVSAFHAALDVAEGCDEVHLCAGPLCHIGPFEFAWVTLNRGHKIVLLGQWDAEDCLRKIATYRVTTSFMVPTMFARMLRLPAVIREPYEHDSLKVVVHAGAHCAGHVKQQMLEWWGPVIYEGYGSTEATGTYASPADWMARPGTVGKPIPGADILILDENGNKASPGQAGRVYIKPYSSAAGFEYLNDQGKTKACHYGEYVYVGDIGYLDEDGYLFLCDRQIDMIISGGVNVYSVEVEHLLLSHDAVVDCAVIGEPDEDLGERVVAFVQLAPGIQPNEELHRSILELLRSRLGHYKRPKVLRFIDTLPRDPNGKLLKRRLRHPWRGVAP